MELTLYMGLLLILLAILSQVFTASIETHVESQQYSSVQHDGRFILNRIAYDIRQSSSVTTPAALGGQGSTLALVIGGTTYTYSVTNGNLLVNGVRLNGYDTIISNFTARRLGNTSGKPTVRFGYTVTGRTTYNGQTEVKSYQTTVGLR